MVSKTFFTGRATSAVFADSKNDLISLAVFSSAKSDKPY
jgi:hypothetical protein